MGNKSVILLLSLALLLLAAGCGPARQTSTSQPAFAAQYIRTNGYHSDRQYPVCSVIKSKAELAAYYEKNKADYDLERRQQVASDYTIGFLDAADKYDDAYFADHLLILVLIEEGSGSNRHLLKDIYLHDGAMNILLERQVPQTGTADMAEWHIMVELKKTDYQDQPIKVYFTLKNV